MIFEAIGTKWEIVIKNEISDIKEKELYGLIMERINEFDKNYSRFRQDSFVTEMSKNIGLYKLQDDAKKLFDAYFLIYKHTNGSVTPLIGKLMEEIGYDSEYSFVPKKLNNPPKWEDAINYNYPNIEIKEPVLIDIGAGGKGYLVDIIGVIMEKYGIKSFMVNAGGDIIYRNTKNDNLRVGLEDPMDFEKIIGVALISNQSICGSAGNRRKWNKYHHIMDPHSLTPSKKIIASWVVAETTLEADLLSTALFFVEGLELKKRSEEQFRFEYLVLYEDRSIKKSDGFNAELFLENEIH